MSDNMKETMDVDAATATIDSLKEEEKEKLATAENAYQQKVKGAVQPGVAVEPAAPNERYRRERRRPNANWLPGAVLIGLGAMFLFNNITGFHLHNWWALFILIPAFGSFSRAYDIVRVEGDFTRDAWGAMAGGMIISLVAATFLFGLDWSLIWPVFLIIGGVSVLLGATKTW